MKEIKLTGENARRFIENAENPKPIEITEQQLEIYKAMTKDKQEVKSSITEEQREIIFKLREETGHMAMDCKKALEKSGYDIEKAKLILHERFTKRNPFIFIDRHWDI